jgi:hypothetical protein
MLAREQAPELVVRVLESERGATVAFAILAPEQIPVTAAGGRRGSYHHSLAEAWTLDLHVHPEYASSLPELLDGLPWPDSPVATSITEPAGLKSLALQSAGFERLVVLPDWFCADDGSRRDMGLWVRR